MFPSSTPRIGAPTGPMYVDQIAEMDVLLGRGTGPNENLGNQIFRNLVKSRRDEYLNAKTPDARQRIFKSTIALVHANGGRFLKKVGDPAAAGAGASSDLHRDGDHSKHIYQVVTDTKTLMYKAKQQFRYAKDTKNKEGDNEQRNGNGQQCKAAAATQPPPPPRTMIARGILLPPQPTSHPHSHLSKERTLPKNEGLAPSRPPVSVQPGTESSSSLQRPQESKQVPSSTDHPPPPPPVGTDFLAHQKQAPQPAQKPFSLSASTDFLERNAAKKPASLSLSASTGFLARQQGKAPEPAPKPFSLSTSTEFLAQLARVPPQHAPKPFSLSAGTEFLARQQGKAPQPTPKSFSLSTSTDFLASQAKAPASFSLNASTDFLARQATKAPAAPAPAAPSPIGQQKGSSNQELLQSWLRRSQERNIFALSKHRLLSPTTTNAPTMTNMAAKAVQGTAAAPTTTPDPAGPQGNTRNHAIDDAARAFLSSFLATAAANEGGGAAGAAAKHDSPASIAASLLLHQSLTAAAQSNDSIISKLLSTNERQWPARQDEQDSMDRSSRAVIRGPATGAGALPGTLPTPPARQHQTHVLRHDLRTTSSNASASAVIVDTSNCIHRDTAGRPQPPQQPPKIPNLIVDEIGTLESGRMGAAKRNESSTDDSATVNRRVKRKGLLKYRPAPPSQHDDDRSLTCGPTGIIPRSSSESSTTNSCSRDSAITNRRRKRAEQQEAFVNNFIDNLIKEQKKQKRTNEGHK